VQPGGEGDQDLPDQSLPDRDSVPEIVYPDR
jgi:hypothetical protein